MDEWVTVSKDEAYDVIVDKTQEAVEMYKDSSRHLTWDHFNMFLPVALEDRDSSVPERKELHEKYRNKGLDTIAVSVNNRLCRLSSWGATKLSYGSGLFRFVPCFPISRM